MIVAMRTKVQAQQVAELTGGKIILKDNKPTCKVSLPGDFEQYRKDVESISVLFKLYDDAGKSVPSGWTLTGATVEVEWPRDSLINSHFGARRFAYNWALAKVKSDMDAKKENSDHKSIPWTLGALRKEWNQEKDTVARGGLPTPKRHTHRGLPIWCRRYRIGRSPSEASARVRGSAFLSSPASAQTLVEFVLPLERCALKMIGALLCFQALALCAPRRTPGEYSAISPRTTPDY